MKSFITVIVSSSIVGTNSELKNLPLSIYKTNDISERNLQLKLRFGAWCFVASVSRAEGGGGQFSPVLCC